MNILTAKLWIALFGILMANLRHQVALEQLKVDSMTPKELEVSMSFSRDVEKIMKTSLEVIGDIKSHFDIE